MAAVVPKPIRADDAAAGIRLRHPSFGAARRPIPPMEQNRAPSRCGPTQFQGRAPPSKCDPTLRRRKRHHVHETFDRGQRSARGDAHGRPRPSHEAAGRGSEPHHKSGRSCSRGARTKARRNPNPAPGLAARICGADRNHIGRHACIEPAGRCPGGDAGHATGIAGEKHARRSEWSLNISEGAPAATLRPTLRIVTDAHGCSASRTS
jgi:hypothetical protein